MSDRPPRKIDDLDAPDAFEASETPTLIPAFDVEAFARASEGKPKPENASDIEAALKSFIADKSDDAPVVELGTADVDVSSYENRGDADEERIRRKLGALSRVPILLPRPADLVGLIGNPREGFLVSLVDGVSPLEAIVDASAMRAPEALQVLADLVERGILGFQDGE